MDGWMDDVKGIENSFLVGLALLDGVDPVVQHLFTAGRHPHRPAAVSRGNQTATLVGLGGWDFMSHIYER